MNRLGSIFVFLLVSLLTCLAKNQQQQYVSVNTADGVMQGKRVDYGNNKKNLYYGQADVFLGIPYAQPPVREKRFAVPEDPPQQTTVYNATYFRPQCIQPATTTTTTTNPQNTSEDCLYLNVFVQNAAKQTTLSAVMVFIDGSVNLASGGLGEDEMKGTVRNLVNHGIIVVTVQYRLGPLGFFSAATRTTQITPNLGMLDQVKALQWVNRNIGTFGGDPNQVTLAGQGGGACAVSAHTLSPMSNNLFQKAILQSGSVNDCYSEDPNYVGLQPNPNPVQNLQYDQGIQYTPIDGQLGFSTGPTTTSTTTTPSPLAGVTNPSQLLAMSLCNVTAEQWRTGNVGDLKSCLHNFTVDTFMKTDGIHTATWLIVRDNLFLNDSLGELAKKRPPIPIIIGTVQDEDADYAFKMVADASSNNSTEGDVFNHWLVDFAKKNKLNSTTTNQVKNIIANNYNVSTGTTRPMYDDPNGGMQTTPSYQTSPSTPVNYLNAGRIAPAQNWQQQQNGGGAQTTPGTGMTTFQTPPVAFRDSKGNLNVTSVYHATKMLTQVSSDAGTVSQTAQEIDSWVQNGNRYVHVYQFTHVSKLGTQSADSMLKQFKDYTPVARGQDKVFLFMNEGLWTAGKPTSDDKKMADQMGQRWADFAKNGSVQGWQPVPVPSTSMTGPTTTTRSPLPSSSNPINYCQLTAQPTMQQGYANEARQVFNDQVYPIVQQAHQQRQFDAPQQNQNPLTPSVHVQSTGGATDWSMSFSMDNFSFGK